MDADVSLRSLRRSVLGLWILVCLGLGGGIFAYLQHSAWQGQHSLRCRVSEDRLVFVPGGDGPFVVHGVAASGESTADIRVAVLPEPVIIVDSAGASVEYSTLKWHDYAGTAAPPPSGQKLVAIYSNVLKSELQWSAISRPKKASKSWEQAKTWQVQEVRKPVHGGPR